LASRSGAGIAMSVSGSAYTCIVATFLYLRYSTRKMESGYSVITICPSLFHLLLNRQIIELVLFRLQFAPQNLPHRRFWDFFDEHIASWTFEPRQLWVRKSKLVEFLSSQRGIGRNNKCRHNLSPALIWQPCHGNLGNFRMLREYIFNFQRMDILSTRNEHIIHSPLHPQVSILVPHSDIPCEIPTLANCLLIGIWSMPIPLEGFW